MEHDALNEIESYYIDSTTVYYCDGIYYTNDLKEVTTDLRTKIARKNMGLTNKTVHPYEY